MAELEELVAARYEALGLPSWPDPHPDRDPDESEYSRVTDPGRYRIVHERARVWASVLADELGVRVEEVPAPPDSGRTIRLVPARPGALPLLFLEREVVDSAGAEPLPVLGIAFAEPDLHIEGQPDCGCDACDSGSADLLEAIDQVVRAVVGGPFVVLRGDGWSADWHPEGGSAHGSDRDFASFDELMRLCARLAAGSGEPLPAGTRAWVGQGWLSLGPAGSGTADP